MAYRWTGSHAYRDHANDRVIEPGAEIPADAAERIAAAHPHQVEEIDQEGDDDGSDDESDADICGFEKDDGSLCQRDAGWGRDADSGRCSDHVDE